MTDVNDITAGKYEIVALRWDQIISKPGEPLNFVRHRRGDVVSLNVEDARRLVLGGAAKKKGDEDPAGTVDGPSVAPGGDATEGDGGGSSAPALPVHEDPGAYNVAQVKEYVGDDPGKATAVLALEQARGSDARSTLVKWLEELATKPADPGAGGS